MIYVFEDGSLFYIKIKCQKGMESWKRNDDIKIYLGDDLIFVDLNFCKDQKILY